MMAPTLNRLQVLPSSGGPDDRNDDANGANENGDERPHPVEKRQHVTELHRFTTDESN